jgi:competence protein ComEA
LVETEQHKKKEIAMRKTTQILTLLAVIFWMMCLVGPAWSQDAPKININTASVEELAKLKRVGPKYAARIVEYRTQNGPFRHPEDLTLVPGIGPKTYEANKNNIRIE